MTNGWEVSAEAWLDELGDDGDFARRFVLDAPMLDWVDRNSFRRALDIGCGEGRFCRMLGDRGIEAIGLDPTVALLEEARRRDPSGQYRLGRAESLPFPAERFDLVVSYLSLIDIDDLDAAVSEMARVLAPGGRLLVANLSGILSATDGHGWTTAQDGRSGYLVDRYLEARSVWVEWRGMRIRNWHRPFSAYMSAFLAKGLCLTHFDEPAPSDPSHPKSGRYARVPGFVLMEWAKPKA